ncbi:hypothetical protein SAMN05216490_3641 [Mucilaginibacter mallensis]|uniref:Uncharacterized protein n=1 Tax=Mucilaginibacter mallensis TaxID=652787 RepID=A0A1H2APS1_MUCMA|nr:hypothetical protein [Mucilaginibacter mallensis]SDT47787.1 hypothetical protein SAMN05216490_3641 [Mucilaginibacter mallensis]
MKELLIFRIFALFPLIGTLIPDLADGFHISFSSIPAEHIIVDVTLLICIALCSAGIMATENSLAESEPTALA